MLKKQATIISTQVLYTGKWLTLRKDTIIKPDGSNATQEVIERKDIVLVIPRVNDTMILVEQYRYAVDQRSLEFPQGFIEQGEDPLVAARRELEEEAGIKSSLIFLGELWASSGFLEQKIHVFYAESHTPGKQNLDVTEKDMKTRVLSIENVKQYIKKGKIKNAPTVAAFSLFLINNK